MSAPPLAVVTVTAAPGGVVAAVTGEVDLSNSTEVAEQLDAVAAAGGPLVLDLSGLAYLDTSGVRALVRLAERPGTDLVVVAPPGSVVRAVLGITHLDRGLDVRDSLPD